MGRGQWEKNTAFYLLTIMYYSHAFKYTHTHTHTSHTSHTHITHITRALTQIEIGKNLRIVHLAITNNIIKGTSDELEQKKSLHVS